MRCVALTIVAVAVYSALVVSGRVGSDSSIFYKHLESPVAAIFRVTSAIGEIYDARPWAVTPSALSIDLGIWALD